MRVAALILAFLGAGAVGAGAVHVEFVTPQPGQMIFGRVTIEALVDPEGSRIEAVEFFLDYQLVARLTAPPYRVEVDVGEESRRHRLEVVARPDRGEPETAVLVTAAVAIDDQVDVRLRQLYVTVTRDGRRVLDLEPGDFTIRDAGQPQEIVTFTRGDIPFTAVVLLDASGSMAGENLATAIAGARLFTERMRPLDEVKLLLFSDRRLRETPFTNLASLVALQTGNLEAGDGTALQDMLFLALKRLDQRQGRRVVLLLSDGVDVDSVVTMADVATALRRIGALLYWVRLHPPGESRVSRISIWRDATAHARAIAALESAVGESGGRVVPVASRGAIGPAFAEILEELRQQYVLGYSPAPAPSGTWRPVSVAVAGWGLRVQAPRGYLAQ